MRREGLDAERNRELKLLTYPCPGYRRYIFTILADSWSLKGITTRVVTSVMLVMSDTPVDICWYASMDIEATPRHCVNIMIIDTQARFRMTFAIVSRC